MTTAVVELRDRLDQLDSELLELIAQRQAIVSEIGRRKHAVGKPLRDFGREKEVLERGKRKARKVGLHEDVAQDIMQRLIYHSLAHQESRRVQASDQGKGRTALVIGGGGRMGGWMASFLAAQGYHVEIADPTPAKLPYRQYAHYSETDLDQDVIVVAAPLRASNRILLRLAELKPAGLIFDIGSLKSPLADGLAALTAAGCKVTSLHPMFGPDVRMLSGRHVLFVDVGNSQAVAEAEALFQQTMAERETVSLDQHDETMAWVLGLSHLINVAFAATLSRKPDMLPLLKRIGSTTFSRQLQVAAQVVAENPRLYFEIQHYNRHGIGVLGEYKTVIEKLMQSVSTGDEDAFVTAMGAACDALADEDAH